MKHGRFPLLPLCLAGILVGVGARMSSAQAPAGPPEDEAIWKKLDFTEDGWLDGKELDGGWVRYDANGDNEVTKAEFMAGRARDRAAGRLKAAAPVPPDDDDDPAPRPAKRPAAKPKPGARPTANPRPAPAAAGGRVFRGTARAGHVTGGVSAAPGVRLGKVTVEVSGFEDGKLATTFGNGALAENVNKTATLNGAGLYAIRVPPGNYRATAYSTYEFNGATYHFPLELTTRPRYDLERLQLEKLRGGIVRDFVLKLTEKKPGASEETETVYLYAYYGGRVDLDATGTGEGVTTALRNAYPPESRVLVTLTPVRLVDGSAGAPVNIDLPLGDDGKWTFNRRGVHPGTYSATARLRTPAGEELPLRLSLTGQYSPEGLKWQEAATFTFAPRSVGPAPRLGVDAVKLYLGR